MTRPEPAGVGTADMSAAEYALLAKRLKQLSKRRVVLWPNSRELALVIDGLGAASAISSAITAAESRAMERCANIAEAQPYYPDTNVGMRQQLVKDQIAATIRSSIKEE